MNRLKIGVIAFLLVSLIFAITVLFVRYKIEKENNIVEMALDFSEVKDLSVISNMSFEDGLRELSKSGANAIFYPMDTLATLIADGRCYAEENSYTITGVYDTFFISQVLNSIFGNNIQVIPIAPDKTKIFYNPESVNKAFLESVPIGFDLAILKTIRETGVIPIARIPYFKGCDETVIDIFIFYLRDNLINQVVFLGDTIMGFKSEIKYVAEKMKDNNIFFGQIEFTDQKGSNFISYINDKYTLQVHSITALEMVSMSKNALIDRYTKAVRERGVRLIFVRLPEFQSDLSFEIDCDYISSIKNSLSKYNYKLGTPKEVGNMPLMRVAKIWASLAVGILAFLLFNLLFEISYKKNVLLFVVLLLLSAGLCFIGGMGLKLLTLILACIAPVYGILYVVKNNKSLSNILLKVLCAFCIVFYAGLINEALLSSNDYMIRNTIFAGIKLAHFVPLLLVALILGFGLLECKDSFRNVLKTFVYKVKKVMKEPMLIGFVVVGVVLLIVIGLMLARSGNDSGMSVSALELRFRDILDKILYVRPRTKEFILGYPCLV